MKKKMDNKGFSLVELIIVIAIMVILVAVLAPQYLKYVEKSRVSTDVQTTVEFINSMQVLASDPDITLTQDSTGNTYKITTSGPKITLSDDLRDALIDAGMLASTDFVGTTGESTSKYQSSGYQGATITISLKYNKANSTWSVVTEGVDSSGKLPTTTTTTTPTPPAGS